MKEIFSAPFFLLLCFSLLIFGCQPAPELEPPALYTEEVVQRGQELAHGLAACGYCHGQQPAPASMLIGGQIRQDRYGEVTVPNLTPAKDGLLGWTAHDVVEAVRASARPNGEPFSAEHHAGYEWLSDEDAYAIAAYLLQLPAIENNTPTRSISSFSKLTTGFSEKRLDVAGYIPEVDAKDSLARGKYLVDHVGRCVSCHTTPSSLFSSAQYLEGGKTIRFGNRMAIASNITGSRQYGIGDWDEEQITAYLRTGRTAENQIVDPLLCPTPFFSRASESELSNIASYLKSTETSE